MARATILLGCEPEIKKYIQSLKSPKTCGTPSNKGSTPRDPKMTRTGILQKFQATRYDLSKHVDEFGE